MALRQQWVQQWPLVLTAALVSAATYALHANGYLSRFEYAVAESRARLLAHETDSDIVIVGIDSNSLRSLSEWPWPRRHYARLLQILEDADPKVLFLDIDFSSRSTPDDDLLFENALAAWTQSPVLLASHFRLVDGAPDPRSLTLPLERFARHARPAAVIVEPSRDGLIRAMRSTWQVGARSIPAVFAAGSSPQPDAAVAIDYSILPSSFGYVSYSELLNGEVDPSSLTGKTVYVGATAVELRDVLPVPVYRTLPGVVVQALATETLRAGPLRAQPAWMYIVLLVLWTGACTLLLSKHTWRRNALMLAGGLVLLGGAALYFHAAHRIDLPVVPLGVVLVSMFSVTTLRTLDMQTWRAIVYAVGLKRRDALLKSIVESSTDCIVCIDDTGAIRMANAATSHLFGCPPRALIGANIESFVPGLAGRSSGPLASAIGQVSGEVSEYSGRAVDGRNVPVEATASRVAIEEERLFTIVIRDISERKAQQQLLEHQATHDSLTGLPNRAALYGFLDAALSSANGSRRVALLLVGLTRLTEVNDTLGHDVGDRVLVEAARRFGDALEHRVFLGRIGGDEFTVALEAVASRDAVDALAGRLIDTLKAPIHVRGIAIEVGATIGIALSPDHAHDTKELLRRADVSMYGAKRRGTPFEYYDQNHDRHTIRRLGMMSELRSALSSDEIALHYQPQVQLQTGRVEAMEALVRWHHPILGSVSPAEFVALAESTNLIRPLTHWTLHQACTDLARWRDRGAMLRVAVNMSAKMLQDVGLAEELLRMLDAHSLDVSQLELEITESAMMVDPDRARRVVQELHRRGFLISIDDYGTGFSSLGYLRDLHAYALKLDKSFVTDVEAREDNRVIVESTAHMAHALGLKIVAEGVETAWVENYLQRVGYDVGQGYWFSRPMPANECFAWVMDFNSATRRRAV